MTKWRGHSIIGDNSAVYVALHLDPREDLKDIYKYPVKRTIKYLPCFDASSIMYLDYYILPYWGIERVCEFGGGNSTIWFAKRVKEVITIEQEEFCKPYWMDAIKQWAKEENLDNITIVTSNDEVTGPFQLTLLDAHTGTSVENMEKAMEWTETGIIAVDGFHDPANETLIRQDRLKYNGWHCFKATPQMKFFFLPDKIKYPELEK